jgi:DNA-binding response OmpR family regulator
MGLAASLKTSGYAVNLARNAQDALDYVRERPVDIVLLDINMPEMGGVEACQRIRALAPQTGIVMLTVRNTNEPDYLRSYVKTLRKKIEDDPGRPVYILTEPWVGYRFRDPSDQDSSPADPATDTGDDDDGL